MNNNKNTLLGALAGIVFTLMLVFGSVLMWFSFIKKNYIVTAENLGKEISVSAGYIVFSFIFMAFLYALCVFGIKLKNKIFALLPVLYELLLIIAFVLLSLFMSGKIETGVLYNVVEIFVLVVFSPVFGAVWSIGFYSLILLLLIAVLSIVTVVLVFKKKKNK